MLNQHPQPNLTDPPLLPPTDPTKPRWVPVVSSTGKPLMQNKLATVFSAHCVDSWVLANHVIGGHTAPDMVSLVELKQLTYTLRQLHVFQPAKAGERRRFGGTRSMGYQRGTLVVHPKYRLCLVGGHDGVDRVSLHAPASYYRLCQNAKPTDIVKIAHTPWWVTDPHATLNREEKRAQRLCKQTQYHHRLTSIT